MVNFEINEEHLCSVNIYKTWNAYKNKENPTEEDLVKVLMGKGECSTLSSDDHPEFKALREQLGREEFIKIQRSWWNGDRVLKPFSLNGAKFRKGEQFPSGAAIKYTIISKLERQNLKK